MSRGNARQSIYLDDQDRRLFLDELGEAASRYFWTLYAFCLMPNHYHLLVQTHRPTLSRGMRHLNGVYTQRWNRRHGRVGHVLQGRYKALLVERDSYLLELSRYLVLNPVRAGLVESAADYPWSSYRATISGVDVPAWLDVDGLLQAFGTESVLARQRYAQFVNLSTPSTSPLERAVGQVYLGSETFVHDQQLRLRRADVSREIARSQRYAGRPALSALLADVPPRDKVVRNARIIEACQGHGYTVTEVAQVLELHPATVARIVRKNAKNQT